MVRVGQGGTRIRAAALATADGAGNTNWDDDQYWKLGMFYFNRNDPAFIVEQRFGIGWTANLANPLTWIVAAAFVVLVMIILAAVYVLR
jgi:uncharacterized membrane protein